MSLVAIFKPKLLISLILETIIQRDTHIQAALYFGRGRLFNGILIQPESHEEVEKLGIEGFRNLVW